MNVDVAQTKILLMCVSVNMQLSLIYNTMNVSLHSISAIYRNRYIRRNENMVLQSAEVKMLIICCCYIILGLAASLAFVISSVYLRALQNELLVYFDCECFGMDSNQMCNRSKHEKFVNPVLLTMGYSLFALYPVITVLYVVKFSSLRDYIKRAWIWYQNLESNSWSSSFNPQ